MVYVDSLFEYPESLIKKAARKHGITWCHMYADTNRELIDMGFKIGLQPMYLQNSGKGPGFEHFDLTPNKRKQAVEAGAIEDDNRVSNMRRIRNETRRLLKSEK